MDSSFSLATVMIMNYDPLALSLVPLPLSLTALPPLTLYERVSDCLSEQTEMKAVFVLMEGKGAKMKMFRGWKEPNLFGS